MKTITLTPTEFFNFKALANQLHIIFFYHVSNGWIHVEADGASLECLGY